MSQLIKIYKSTITNGPVTNLGGPPLIELQDDEYLNGFFNWDSIHSSSVYSVLYAKNDNYSATTSNLSVAIQVRIDYDKNLDISEEYYLRSLTIDLLRPQYAEIGYVHPPITVDGYFIDAYPKRVIDFVQADEFGRKILFIDDTLQPGQFFPFIVRLTLKEPLGTIFKQPIKFNIYSGVF